ncbi:Hypothetical predicted protein [Podarcis lilfordi]|uniref:Uncharacterized protein n=1 Tax=Podarcis lilfordi TaxID=74358 RepID=A0AA35L1T7_9SAUR|nr:Hypothetical predicted protein [Podarcis lilfordi]
MRTRGAWRRRRDALARAPLPPPLFRKSFWAAGGSSPAHLAGASRRLRCSLLGFPSRAGGSGEPGRSSAILHRFAKKAAQAGPERAAGRKGREGICVAS